MKQLRPSMYVPVLFVTALLILSTAAWNQNSERAHSAQTDTLPKKSKKITDIDDVLKELDKGTVELDNVLKEIDWKSLEADLKVSLNDIKIDKEKIKKDIEISLKGIDVTKIKLDIEKSLKEIDLAKLKIEVDASLSKIDWDKIKEDIEKVKEIDLKKIEIDLKGLKPEIEESLAAAKVDIEKAKRELTEYKEFINTLEKEGAISKKEGYKIEHRDGTLIINDKKQSAEVYNKFRTFLEKHKTFTLKKDLNDFDIDMD